MFEIENSDFVSVETDISQVPFIIQEQVKGLRALKEHVIEAMKKAEIAKQAALSAKEKSAGLFQKKEAIESIQLAIVDVSDGLASEAQAQEIFFIYQQRIAEITKYLFALGVSNIAMNRSVVRELELKLKGASAEELDEFARQEIINVVKQLKAQEDIMKKTSVLSEKVRAHESSLRSQGYKDSEYERRLNEHDRLLAEKSEKDKSQDEEIAYQAVMDEQLGKKIDAGEKKDKSQDKEIARQAAICQKLEKRIDAGEEKVRNQDKEIARHTAIDEKLGKRIDAVVKKDKSQDEELARQAAMNEELGKRIDAVIEKDQSQDEEIARQAAVDEELGKRIDAGVEKDQSQDEEIARQTAKIAEFTDLVNQLMESNLEKETQIIELKSKYEELSSRILEKTSIVENKESDIFAKLNEKANKKAVLVSFAIGMAGMIAAVIQFFI